MGEEGKKKEELHNIRPKSSKKSHRSEICLNPIPFFFIIYIEESLFLQFVMMIGTTVLL